MKQFLLTLSTVTTLTIASNTMFNSMMIVVQKNNIASKKKILPVIPINQNKSLFNNQYGYLNNDDWISNQSIIDNKYYSYNTNHADYLLSDGKTLARTLFIIDNKGELIYKKDAMIPDKDKVDVNNTKQEMIFHRKVATINNPTNSYSGSQYDINYFAGDGINWKYVQQSEVETHIDISQQENANNVENNNSLSEGLGLYYIAKAVRESDDSFKEQDADILAHYFITQSSLNGSLSDVLIDKIIHLLITNDNAYDYITNVPFLTNDNSKYTINYIFDEFNNIIQIYYSYYDKAFDLSTLSLIIPQQVISVKTPEATPITDIKANLVSKIQTEFKQKLSQQLKINSEDINDKYYNIFIKDNKENQDFTNAVNIEYKITSSWKNANQLNFAGTYQGQVSVINKCVDLSNETDLKNIIENAYYHQNDKSKWLNVDVDNTIDNKNVDTKLTQTTLDLINTNISTTIKVIVQNYFKTHDTELIIDETDYDVTTTLAVGDNIFNNKLGKDFTISIKDNGSTYKLKNSLDNINVTIHGHNKKSIAGNFSRTPFDLDGIWLKDGKDTNVLQEGQHFYEQNKLLDKWISNKDSLLNTIVNNSYYPIADSFGGNFIINYILDGKNKGSITADISKDITSDKVTNFWDLITKTKSIFLETDVSVSSDWALKNVKLIFTNDEIQPTKDNTLYIFDLSDRFKGETVSERATLTFPDFNFNYQLMS
ncbi:hypothetical protein [Spiroplasma endosymbiont of Aleiodes alternator]|uniref:hypothetical protein n=1 Tax=Spiroplasma endosymbiont of Aleiodes alternator TaxID=3139329 RepID=UPI003CCB1417